MTTPSGLPLKALQYWGAAYGAVQQRASTADVWAAINNQAGSVGSESAGVNLQTFNQLRSQAVGVRNAVESFDANTGEHAITGDQVGNVPWQRDQGTRNAAPKFQVTFLHETSDLEGNVTEQYRSVYFTGPLLMTKQELLDQIERDAEALADNYNSVHIGTSGHQVYAV